MAPSSDNVVRKKNGIVYWMSLPDGPTAIRGTVILTHGYSEHAGAYNGLIRELVGQNWAVVSYDVRGHGDSVGERGFIANFNQYLKDLEMIQEIAEKDIPKTETGALVFFGHSMGGLITLKYLIHLFEMQSSKTRNIKACVLSAPFIRTANELSLSERFLVWLVNKLEPTHQNPFDAGFEVFLSHDETYVKNRAADSKCFHHSTIGWFAQCRDAQAHVNKHIAALKNLPTYWFLAGEDRVVDSPSARALAVKLQEQGGKDRHVCFEYPTFYHDLFQEKERSRPIAQFKQQILAKL